MFLQTSGAWRRENADAYPLSSLKIESERHGHRVPDAVQRVTLRRRAGTHKLGPGVASHHDASASRCAASGAREPYGVGYAAFACTPLQNSARRPASRSVAGLASGEATSATSVRSIGAKPSLAVSTR
jgi:hypothetical protein